MKNLLAILIAVAAIACGGGTGNKPDAGPDTSCGLDCSAQQTFGLILNRCFEYSTSQSTPSNPADLGAIVKPVETLEGGLKVIPLEYRQNGQPKMTDYFFFQGGDLWLARRNFPTGDSMTYKDASGNIVGAPWLKANSISGENFTTQVQADVTISGQRRTDDTAYKITLATPTASELKVHVKTYDQGLQMLLSETPDHGVDPRRVFVKDTGFILFTTRFAATTAPSTQEYRLQKIRDLGGTDGGVNDCGFGSP